MDRREIALLKNWSFAQGHALNIELIDSGQSQRMDLYVNCESHALVSCNNSLASGACQVIIAAQLLSVESIIG